MSVPAAGCCASNKPLLQESEHRAHSDLAAKLQAQFGDRVVLLKPVF